MCSRSRIIAKLSEYRFIAHCDCCEGIVHLAWDNLTLSLSPEDFVRLENFLGDHPTIPETQRKGFLEANTQAERTRLWIGNIGIRLDRLEWSELRHLCFEAQRQMARAPTKSPVKLLRLTN